MTMIDNVHLRNCGKIADDGGNDGCGGGRSDGAEHDGGGGYDDESDAGDDD